MWDFQVGWAILVSRANSKVRPFCCVGFLGDRWSACSARMWCVGGMVSYSCFCMIPLDHTNMAPLQHVCAHIASAYRKLPRAILGVLLWESRGRRGEWDFPERRPGHLGRPRAEVRFPNAGRRQKTPRSERWRHVRLHWRDARSGAGSGMCTVPQSGSCGAVHMSPPEHVAAPACMHASGPVVSTGRMSRRTAG